MSQSLSTRDSVRKGVRDLREYLNRPCMNWSGGVCALRARYRTKINACLPARLVAQEGRSELALRVQVRAEPREWWPGIEHHLLMHEAQIQLAGEMPSRGHL